MEKFFLFLGVFVLAIVIAGALAFLQAFVVWIIFNIIGIPFLNALSYWQVFGLTWAVGVMTSKGSSSSSSN